MSLYMAWFSRK